MTTGLTAMFDHCVAYFGAQGWPCIQEFGWRVVDHKIDELANYNRIYWSPGDQGSAGVWGSARYPGNVPRSLGTLYELCTVTICAYDITQPEIERAQYEATMALAMRWLNAMHFGTPSNVAYQAQRWLDRQKVRSKGAALQIVWSIQTVVPELDGNAGVNTYAIQAPIDVSLEVSTTETWTERVTATVARHVFDTDVALTGLQGFEADECALVTGQNDATENGLYQIADGAWTRSPIALVSGLFVEVVGVGRWELTTADPIVVGTSDIVFELVP